MMRWQQIGCLSVAVLLSIVATPASAQKTGTRLDQNRGAVGSISRLDPKSAVRATNAFGQCIAQREVKPVRRALELPFASPEQMKILFGTIETYDACLGTSNEFDALTFPPILFAGAAAEWFVRLEQRKIDLTPLAGMTDKALAESAYKPRNGLEDLGLCVVRRNPKNGRNFVTSRVGEVEEKTALNALLPDVGPCVFEGQKVALNAANLRAIIAYALYRAASKLGAAGA